MNWQTGSMHIWTRRATNTSITLETIKEHKLSKAFKNYAVLAKPAYKNFNVQDKGRPEGGLAIPQF